MKAGKYNIRDLFVNRYLLQLVVPEIQRDYVWAGEQVESFLDSIVKGYTEYLSASIPAILLDDEELAADFLSFYKRRKYSSNIGFIYAYSDDQLSGKYFLIDGQQRITTIYLLLLAIVSRNKTLVAEFKSTYQYEDRLKLDYRVREASHEFMIKFVEFSLKNETESVVNQSWYYQDYENDVTISNILKNFETILDYLETRRLNEIDLFYYVENLVDFWYFDTNISEQGEELYIYMNARGEQMQSNENIKADLLGRIDDPVRKNEYGLQWESWQDFFWEKKGVKNENADVGFNEFLCSISALENYLNDVDKCFYPQEKFTKMGIKVKDLIGALDLNKIEKHINALKYFEEKKELVKRKYRYSDWVDKCWAEIWRILNNEKTNWHADYNDENRGTERNRMVLLWSILYYLERISKDEIDEVVAFRTIRIFYLRYHNFVRGVRPIKAQVELIISGSYFNDAKEQQEETLKYLELERHDAANKLKVEELIWEIEDHKFNLDGKDVGGINISHLVDLKSGLSKEKLTLVKEKFYELFPPNEREYQQVQNILFHYGCFWYVESPFYYTNLLFDSWKRIIRDRSDRDNISRNAFSLFFKEFLDYPGNVDEFIIEKNNQVIDEQHADDLRKKLLWYNQRIGNLMWQQGNYLAYSNGGPCALPEWKGKDSIFNDLSIIYNTKGDLKGGSPTELAKLLQSQ